MATYIEPRVLKGFRDSMPQAEIARKGLIDSIESSFKSFGFVPIDTPCLEYAEILLGKGGGETEKQVYRFKDNGGRDVALRYDLTVPFARFMAEHRAELPLPFKRYHIAKAWRGENTQRGRYREFIQCDFDIVGSPGPAADFEILLVLKNTLEPICGGGVKIHFNHRGLFNRFLARLGLTDKSVEVLRTVDKLAKIGTQQTLDLLAVNAGDKANQIINYIEAKGTFEERLGLMTEAAGGSCPESECLARIYSFMKDTGSQDSFILDPSITRGLDYYTGIVYETLLNDMPEIGSVGSGGRYDNLVGLYTKPNSAEQVGGVGASIGIDRLIAALESLGRLNEKATYSMAAIACVREEDAGLGQALAGKLRKEGIPCEVFADAAKLPKQYMLAEKKGIKWLIIPGENSFTGGAGSAVSDSGTFTVRDLSARDNRELKAAELVQFLNSQKNSG
ncbi:MAG: histidine--tRNA ligase [Treponema sp.]|nr:histidine--tRNA ligase [Treponema sp.]